MTAFFPFFHLSSKLTQDNRIESPIPILPLPTPDTETEKLIKMKDEEVRPISAWTSLVLELESEKFLQDCPIEAVLGLPTPASNHHELLVWRTGCESCGFLCQGNVAPYHHRFRSFCAQAGVNTL